MGERVSGRLAGWQAGKLAGFVAGWQASWLASRLAGWLAGSLACGSGWYGSQPTTEITDEELTGCFFALFAFAVK